MKNEIEEKLKEWNYINKRNSIKVGFINSDGNVDFIHVLWIRYIEEKEKVIQFLVDFSQEHSVKEWLSPTDERLK